MRVLVFGDSITQGFWDSRGGWVQRLRSHYDEKSLNNLDGEWVVVFNQGVDGNEVPQVEKRLVSETKARQWPQEPVIIVLAVGLNDSLMRGEDEAYSFNDFTDNYQKLIKAAKGTGDKVVGLGLTSVNDKLCNPWEYSSSGKSWQNDRIEVFNNLVREACQAADIAFIDIFYKFKQAAETEELLADGLHPNNKGHELIVSLVKPELDRLIK